MVDDGWSGMWRVVAGSGRDGFDGAVGQGQLTERVGVGEFKRIDYSGTISCHRRLCGSPSQSSQV